MSYNTNDIMGMHKIRLYFLTSRVVTNFMKKLKKLWCMA